MTFRCFQIISQQSHNVIVSFLITGLLYAGNGAACAQSLVGGPASSGMGHASTALRGDFWSPGNPAVSGSVSGRAIGLFASQAFGLDELQHSSIRYVEPLSPGNFGLEIQSFGFQDFRDTRAAFDFARALGFGSTRKLIAGVRVQYRHISITGYNSTSAIGISLGALTSLLPSLSLGFAASNVNQPKVAGSNLDRNLSVGLLYEASERMRFAGDVLKEIRFPVSFRAGIEVKPADVLIVRSGITTNPTRFTSGIAVRVTNIEASFTTERHENLGWSPAAGLSILW
ncbi:MAG: hypothetical protein HKN43_15075 [Rhodothermales bacterium]|nr:hypothetical protein [Rhodothermales bacterium]